MAEETKRSTPNKTSASTSTTVTTPVCSLKSTEVVTKPSLGEELFLVHLQRFETLPRSPEDYDHGITLTRATSRGEELWNVHCTRMEHCEPDYDIDIVNEQSMSTPTTTSSSTNVLNHQRAAKVKVARKKTVRPRNHTRVIHLRNRNVKVS